MSDVSIMEDWLEDLVDSRDRLEFFDMKKALMKHGFDKDIDLSLLFSNPEQHGPLSIFWRQFCKTVFNNENILYFLALLAALFFLRGEVQLFSAVKLYSCLLGGLVVVRTLLAINEFYNIVE